MAKIISVKINVTKIDKLRLFKGKNGTYLDCALIPSSNDQYGNDFMVVQNVTKEERAAGKRGEIIGNGKWFGSDSPRNQQAGKQPQPAQDNNGDDVPF
jgi:hypothetical protein